ncbi:MAG: hemoblobin-interacting domain-containing protein [Paludibacter sp.]
MKKEILLTLFIVSSILSGFAQNEIKSVSPAPSTIYANPITTGRPIATNYLGDKLSTNWYFQFEIGQASWNASEVGIGQNTDGTTGWNWATATWYADGTNPNKKVQRNIGNFQFTATGTWYAVGRAKALVGDAWTYTDEVSWTNETTLTASTTTKNCPYFTVNELGNPTSCIASISETTATLSWTKFMSYNVMIVRYAKNATPTAPTNGTGYALNIPIGLGTVIYTTNNGTSTTNTVTASTDYDYYFYSENWSYYSTGVKVTALGVASTPPTLTAASNANVDASFYLTFTEDATWRGAITGITVGGTILDPSAYNKTVAGKITFTPLASTLLQSSGTKAIIVSATGYSTASVSQILNPGVATKLAIVKQPTAPAVNAEVLAVQPWIILQDQYSNKVSNSTSVTAAVGAGTWTIGGTATQAATNDTIKFVGLTATSVTSVTGATITFTSVGLTAVTSGTFNIPAPAQIDWANLQFPQNSGTGILLGGDFTVFAQVYEPGITTGVGQGAGIKVWIGYNSSNTDPSTWVESDWALATYSGSIGNNDEYFLNIGSAIPTIGTYYYASRFQIGTASYVYGGYNSGFWNGTTNVSGTLIVKLAPPTACTASSSATTATLGWTKAGVLDVMVVKYAKGISAISPTNGKAYAVNDTIGVGIGKVVYNGSNTTATSTIELNTDYDFYFYSVKSNDFSSGVKVTASRDKFVFAYGIDGKPANEWTYLTMTQNANNPDQYEVNTTLPDLTGLSCYVGWNGGGTGEPVWTNSNGGHSNTVLMSSISTMKSGLVWVVVFKDSTSQNWGVNVPLNTSTIESNTTKVSIYSSNSIIYTHFAGIAQVELFNSTGQLIRSVKAENQFSQMVKTGIYMIRINGKTHKVLVQ